MNFLTNLSKRLPRFQAVRRFRELLARTWNRLDPRWQRAEIDRKVAERTAELSAENLRLTSQLADSRRAEHALRASEAQFRHLADQAPVGIWVMDSDQRLAFLNRRAAAFAVQSALPLNGHGWIGAVHPNDLQSVRAQYSAAVEARCSFRIECRVRRANGSYRWVLHTGVPRFMDGVYAGHVGSSIDITGLKLNHERSLVTSKLDGLEALAAGIAHNFNNLVGSIYGASDLALADLPPDSPARESIERIHALATRASEIVNLLMTYAGSHGADTEEVDLSQVVADMLELLRASISSKIRLDIDLARDLPPIRANATQIRQIVLNLIMNASESLKMEEGIVKVTTGRVFNFAEPSCELPQGEYCRLVVADTGCGFNPDVQARLFEPFYTTKVIGRGLGLAVVQGILRSHRGAINVRSTPGAGSAFEVLLPCAGKRGAAALRAKEAIAGCPGAAC